MRRLLPSLLVPLCILTACIPYTVATTAEPVRRGERSTTMSTFVMPSFGRLDSARTFSNLVVDFESRWGLDERSDVGVRIPSGSGMIVNYKYLLTAPASRTKVAILPGAGFVNLGQHAHFELSLVASKHAAVQPRPGRDTTLRKEFTPYGGLRVMQVAPLARGAVSDRPTDRPRHQRAWGAAHPDDSGPDARCRGDLRLPMTVPETSGRPLTYGVPI